MVFPSSGKLCKLYFLYGLV